MLVNDAVPLTGGYRSDSRARHVKHHANLLEFPLRPERGVARLTRSLRKGSQPETQGDLRFPQFVPADPKG